MSKLKLLFFLLVLISGSFASSVPCSQEGRECEYDGENLLDNLMQVNSERECQLLCLENQQCQYTTYFNDSASPISNFCRIFKTCENTVQCENCVTQNRGCFDVCSSNIVGPLDENVVDVMVTKAEHECRDLCTTTEGCYWYTYFDESDPLYHETCFLLSALLPPLEAHKSAASGPKDCSKSCLMDLNDEKYQFLKLTDTYTNFQIKVLSRGGSCTLRLLAVGGGGEGFNGGGGSGYIQYRNITLNEGLHSVSAKVGDRDQRPSVVTIDDLKITAEAGQNGHVDGSNVYHGGDGYSGGGGHMGPYQGGSNGQDGYGVTGGPGTGENVRNYFFSFWTLTPGLGGTPLGGEKYCSGYCGGGGGGVMVNGEGPGNGIYSGQGYGGGGGGYGYSGEKGVILFESEPV